MSNVIVRVKQGRIQGKEESSRFFSSKFYSFYGVPYAEPPIADLRFKDPVKVQPWKGIRNGVFPKDAFIQYSPYASRMIGSEDILYVNVHTPKLPQQGEPLKAVMVMIHPGRQLWGSPNPDHHGSPDYALQNDLVYITVGFRLSLFGFLNLKMKECSGNQGLKDIIMAFQWIRENIQSFNGDPTNVSVIGGSSGAALIHLLLLSPAAKDLFHKAIIMGGYAFNCLGFQTINQLSLALDFAHDLGFKGDDPKKMLRFFKKTPAEIIVTAMHKFEAKLIKDKLKSFLGGPFAETVDETVLPVSPRYLISSMQRIPLIFGICERESIFGFLDKQREIFEKKFDSAYRLSVWGWPHTLTDGELVQLNNKVHSFYSQHLPEETTPLCYKIDIMSDAAYSEVYDTLIDVISSDYPVFVYKFQYEGEMGVLKTDTVPFINENVTGTFHCDDFTYWVRPITYRKSKTRQVMSDLSRLWSTFAKTGDPNYEGIQTQWIATTPEKPCYLSIDEEMKMIDGKLNGERFEFWDNLRKQFKHD